MQHANIAGCRAVEVCILTPVHEDDRVEEVPMLS
jgi:hypothetical protein